MKLHDGISKNCVAPLGNFKVYIQGSWKFHMVPHGKFLSLAPGISTFCFSIPLEISCPQPLSVCFFFLKQPINAVTLIISYHLYISSFWWVVNILLRKFDTSWKKRNKNDKNANIWCKIKKKAKKVYVYQYKAGFLSLPWTCPIDLWCNMFETLEIQRMKLW